MKAIIEDILQLLEDMETVPPKLREEIMAETRGEVLRKWHRVAACSDSIEEFMKKKAEL